MGEDRKVLQVQWIWINYAFALLYLYLKEICQLSLVYGGVDLVIYRATAAGVAAIKVSVEVTIAWGQEVKRKLYQLYYSATMVAILVIRICQVSYIGKALNVTR